MIAEKPDYIIHDSLCVWGKCIAQILNVPAISSVTALLRPSSLFHRAVFASLPTIMSMAIRQSFEGRAELAKFHAISRQLQKTYGIPRTSLNDVYNNLAELNIVYSTRQLQIPPARYGDDYLFVGPFIEQRSDVSLFPFDELEKLGTGPVIYMSLGTVFNNKGDIYRLCIEAFADLKYRVILSVGSKIDIASLGAIPANFIVKPFVPQLQILQHAALFITHAGMNSVSEGLYEGVPLLMLPQAADQAFIATRVEQLGAGKVLHAKHLNALSLRNAAEEVLAQQWYRQASAAIGTSFRQCGGPALAADAIETFKRKHGL